jgi:hypothetical protein
MPLVEAPSAAKLHHAGIAMAAPPQEGAPASSVCLPDGHRASAISLSSPSATAS